MRSIYNFQVQPKDVDFQKEITFVALGDYILDAAGQNAEANGFGMQKLHSLGCSWVLSRIAIELHEKPTEYRHFKIETWVDEVSRLATTRNFKILNAENKVIGGACSNWVMFDMKTRRPADLLAMEGLKEVEEHDAGIIEKPIRLTSVEAGASADFTVKYSDIDTNGHVNSMSYAEWLCDLFSLDFYKQKQIRRFELNYVNESFWGDHIHIYKEEKAPDDYHFEIKRSDKSICKARILWV
jgi:acyl-ACP thioesterase